MAATTLTACILAWLLPASASSTESSLPNNKYSQETCSIKYWTQSRTHSACLMTQGTPPAEMRENNKRLIVSLHNAFRGNVEMLPGQPPAANMQAMIWDDELAAIAAKWASTCSLEHDHAIDRAIPGSYEVGQNLAMGRMSWADALTHWRREGENFAYDQGHTLPSVDSKVKIGHYVQLVWAASARVGCAAAACPSIGRFFVCNYAHAAGVHGRSWVPYEHGKKGAACPLTYNEDTGLCDCKGKLCKNDGVLDVATCQCKCPMRAPWLQSTDCSMNCSLAEDRKMCLSRGGPWGVRHCQIYSNVKYEHCPIMCKLCQEDTDLPQERQGVSSSEPGRSPAGLSVERWDSSKTTDAASTEADDSVMDSNEFTDDEDDAANDDIQDENDLEDTEEDDEDETAEGEDYDEGSLPICKAIDEPICTQAAVAPAMSGYPGSHNETNLCQQLSYKCPATCGQCLATKCKDTDNNIRRVGETWLNQQGFHTCTGQGVSVIQDFTSRATIATTDLPATMDAHRFTESVTASFSNSQPLCTRLDLPHCSGRKLQRSSLARIGPEHCIHPAARFQCPALCGLCSAPSGSSAAAEGGASKPAALDALALRPQLTPATKTIWSAPVASPSVSAPALYEGLKLAPVVEGSSGSSDIDLPNCSFSEPARCGQPSNRGFFLLSQCIHQVVKTACPAMCGQCRAVGCLDYSGHSYAINDVWLSDFGQMTCLKNGVAAERGCYFTQMRQFLLANSSRNYTDGHLHYYCSCHLDGDNMGLDCTRTILTNGNVVRVPTRLPSPPTAQWHFTHLITTATTRVAAVLASLLQPSPLSNSNLITTHPGRPRTPLSTMHPIKGENFSSRSMQLLGAVRAAARPITQLATSATALPLGGPTGAASDASIQRHCSSTDEAKCGQPSVSGYYTASQCQHSAVVRQCPVMCGQCQASSCKDYEGNVHAVGISWVWPGFGKMTCTPKGVSVEDGCYVKNKDAFVSLNASYEYIERTTSVSCQCNRVSATQLRLTCKAKS